MTMDEARKLVFRLSNATRDLALVDGLYMGIVSHGLRKSAKRIRAQYLAESNAAMVALFDALTKEPAP